VCFGLGGVGCALGGVSVSSARLLYPVTLYEIVLNMGMKDFSGEESLYTGPESEDSLEATEESRLGLCERRGKNMFSYCRGRCEWEPFGKERGGIGNL